MLAPGTIVGPLRIIRLLGRGGMGEVYEAEQVALRRRVAVKRISEHLIDRPDLMRRFAREAQTIARVHGEHVVTVHEFGQYPDANGDEHMLLVLELVEGGLSLRQVLDCGILPWPAATSVIRQAANGLLIAAEHGIVHRDIKPDNLLLTRRGVVKLSDFGLAKAFDSTAISLAGSLLGTPAYLAPELCTGGAGDARSDLYALGATWFHLLAGRPPFAAETTLAMLHCHLNDPPPDVRELSPAVPAPIAALVDRMLAKRPEERPADAAAVIAAIDAIAAGGHPVPALVPELARVMDAAALTARAETLSPTPPTADPPVSTVPLTPMAEPPEARPAAPRRWLAPAAIAAALGVALVVGIGLGQRPPPPAPGMMAAQPPPEPPTMVPPPTAMSAPAEAGPTAEIDALEQQLRAALRAERFGDAQRVAELLASRGLLPARVAAAEETWRVAEAEWLTALASSQVAAAAGRWAQAYALLTDVPDDRVYATRAAADRREPLVGEVRRGAAAAFNEVRLRVQEELDAGRPQMARHYLMMAHPLADIARAMSDYERTMRRIEQAERTP